MITVEEGNTRSKTEEEKEGLNKTNAENEAKAKSHKEVVNILAEEVVKIATEEEDASMDTSMKNERTGKRLKDRTNMFFKLIKVLFLYNLKGFF